MLITKTPSGIVIVCKFIQFANAYSSIIATLDGSVNVILVNPEEFANAYGVICIRVSGKTMDIGFLFCITLLNVWLVDGSKSVIINVLIL